MAKQKFDFKTMHLSDIPKFFMALIKGEAGGDEEMMKNQTGFYEINLVPDVKAEMIKTQKIRNLVFFICIVVCAASASSVVILGSIKGAQDLTMMGQDSHIESLAKKILDYDELTEFLTIQNQINGISKIEDSQKVLSRAVMFLNSLLPDGADTVSVSELAIDLNESTLSFDAQANAGKEPKIDYRVLEAFMKRTNLMTFDYGHYVDSSGNQIPSRCIEEYDPVSGKMYEKDGSIYAIWKRGRVGCDPTRDDYIKDSTVKTVSQIDIDFDATDMRSGTSSLTDMSNTNTNTSNNSSNKTNSLDLDEEDEDEDEKDEDESDGFNSSSSLNSSSKTSNTSNTSNKTSNNSNVSNNPSNESNTSSSKTNTTNNNKTTVTLEDGTEVEQTIIEKVPDELIYRTPQFTTWYEGKEVRTIEDGIDDEKPAPTDDGIKINVTNYKYTPNMNLDGSISGIPHFESDCIEYSGTSTVNSETGKEEVQWSAENSSCLLVPEGIVVSSSSNGLDVNNELVLRFSAIVKINPDAFAFRNKHVMAIGPNKQNVTDSYVQLEKIFAAPARDCTAADKECLNTNTTKTGE